ncbi:MAG: hypothetical protein LZ168_07185 [Thaumarchaeota archaeon]|jgi:hypothetical protein|nr:hypothetical protein [Candidatus Geocrenenecus arthurdayi]
MDVARFMEAVKELAIEEKHNLVEELLDILLSSVNLEMVPDDVGWRINQAYRGGKLTEEEILRELAYAVSIAEPAKFRRIIEKLKVED